MTKEILKVKYPNVYDEIVNVGVQSERMKIQSLIERQANTFEALGAVANHLGLTTENSSSYLKLCEMAVQKELNTNYYEMD
jgi:hypothetical protein